MREPEGVPFFVAVFFVVPGGNTPLARVASDTDELLRDFDLLRMGQEATGQFPTERNIKKMVNKIYDFYLRF